MGLPAGSWNLGDCRAGIKLYVSRGNHGEMAMNTTHQAAATPELPPKLQIVVQLKHNYGNQAIYPVCAKAMTFAVMLGQRTLTPNDIEHIRSLGYTIAVDPQQPKEL